MTASPTAAPPARGRPAAAVRLEPQARTLLSGGLAAVVAGVLAGAAAAGGLVFAAVVTAVQVVLVLVWVATVRVPGRWAAVGLGVIAAVAATVAGGTVGRLDPIAGVLGVALVGALALQLARRQRPAVTASLAGALTGVVLVAGLAALVAMRSGAGLGRAPTLTVLVTAAVVPLVGRAVDTGMGGRSLAPRARRTRAGVGAALAAGTLAAAPLGLVADEPTGGWGPGAAAATGALVAAALLLADVCLARSDRSADVRGPGLLLGVLLPLALASPVGYLAATVLR